MRALWTCLFLLVIWMNASACRADSPPTEDVITAFSTATLTQTVAPSITVSPSPTRQATKQPQQVEPTSTTVVTIKPNPVICAPLAETALEELFEIISSPYDPPPMGKDDRHQGVDFSYYRRGERLSIAGEIVQVVLTGRVAAVMNDRRPYGNMVIIETPKENLPPELAAQIGITETQSLYHLYAHFGEAPLVEFGQQVECGDPLGVVGTTGYNIVNPHLHLEIRVGPSGQVFEGMAYYDTQATPAEMESYERWRMSGEFQHFNPLLLFEYFQVLE